MGVKQNLMMMMTALLRGKANPDTARTTDGATPVFAASAENSVEVFDCLIEAKCTTVDTPANDSCTPLHMSAHFGHLSIVKRLVELKADVNRKSKWGTPLEMASSQSHTDVTKFLSSL